MKHSPEDNAQRRPGRLRRGAAVAASAALVAVGLVSAPAMAAPSGSGSDTQRQQATPDIAALAGPELASQTIEWEACETTEPEYEKYFALARCADVKVPVDWFKPADDYWTVRISFVENSAVGSPGHRGVIFGNPGGPGGSGLVWGPVLSVRTPELNTSYNYVGFDPRGVGESSMPDECLLPELSDDEQLIAETCSTQPENQAISTRQTAYDMDLIRHLLGEQKLSYIGYSYGTWLGGWYAKEFPANAGAMLLDSATDVTGESLEQTWYMQPIARDRQFSQKLLPYVARHNDVYGLGTDADAIGARYFAAMEAMGDSGLLLWLAGGLVGFPDNSQYPTLAANLQLIIEVGEAADEEGLEPEELTPAALGALILRTQSNGSHAISLTDLGANIERALVANERKVYDEPSDYPKADLANPDFDPCYEAGWASWDWTDFDDSTVDWRSCDWAIWDEWENDPELQAEMSEADIITFQLQGIRAMYLALRDGGFMKPTWYDEFENIRCNDGQWATSSAKYDDPAYQAQIPFSLGLGSGVAPMCRFWTASTVVPSAKANTFPGALVVQSEMDSQTAYETGMISGTKLPRTSFIAVDNEGSHGLFPYGTECVDRPVIDYFLTGALPKDKVSICSAIPLPGEEDVYENWTRLRPNGKPGKAVESVQTPAVIAAGDIARSLIAEQEEAVLVGGILSALAD